MELHVIETGRFRLDGGAMFGVVPKPLWAKTNPPDDRNRIQLAMRCLLIRDGDRAVLIDCGIGHKYTEKFAGLYAIDHTQTLEASLKQHGLAPTEITDLVLTHLHFDHGGGATYHDANGTLQLTFPNARHWVQRKHLDWALQPNAREVASFLTENVQPVAEAGNLHLLDGETELFPGLELLLCHGHTESQQLPLIHYKGYQILFAADLIPTHGHLPLPYVMGYDTRPLLTLEERALYLPRTVQENWLLFFEHDPELELATVVQDERGKFTVGEALRVSELG